MLAMVAGFRQRTGPSQCPDTGGVMVVPGENRSAGLGCPWRLGLRLAGAGLLAAAGAIHLDPVGDKRPEWTADDQRTTLVLLVQGSFRIDLTETSVTLEKQGDYAAWGPGIDHSWEAITDAVVITVRWPSSPA